jgi:hypothetical protein
MTRSQPTDPPYPRLLACAILSVWIVILSLPMLTGNFIAAPGSDQYFSGYAFREWAAQQWLALGHYPLWNPEIYAGLPFVAGMHGDVFYPTAFLRLILPTHTAMNLGFFVHYILAGVFAYWFLRLWRVSWSGAVIGGLAFQLSGVIGSYVRPGHDGKLFVTALLPLGLIGLTYAIRDKRWEGYGLFALTVGLSLLSPHPQMAQYFLIAAGIFSLYLTFGEPSSTSIPTRLAPLGIALVAVAVGVGISAVQYMPFYAYIPYSPRHESVLNDFLFSASFGIPWGHVPELFLSRFAGESLNGTYYGTNGIKFHSEYLGLPVIGLAALGILSPQRRRMILWLAGIGILFLLVALSDSTPFYRIWWEVVPFTKSTRAPGMALFVVSFIVATLAAFGVDRLQQQEQPSRWITGAFAAGVGVVVLGAVGVFGAIAESIAQAAEMTTGSPMTQVVPQALPALRTGAITSGVALMAIAGAAWSAANRKITIPVMAGACIAVVGADLWWNARTFWVYSRAQETLYADDPIKSYLREQPKPYRVFNWGPNRSPVYPQASLMADNIPQWYGHHGNELHAFDLLNERLGHSLIFEREGHPALMELYAIRYLIVDAAVLEDTVPGFRTAIPPTTTSSGRTAVLLERTEPPPYARLVLDATKASMEQTIATVLDSRFPLNHIVLLDSATEHEPNPVSRPLPEPLDVAVEFEEWEPGRMTMRIPGGAPRSAYLVVSENYYPDWQALVDGETAPVLRGNGTLITVPVPAGSERIELTFRSREFRIGRMTTFASLLIVAGAMAVPPVLRRRSSD